MKANRSTMRRMAMTLGVAALVTTGTVSVASPAQALLGDCPSNRICGWYDSNFTGGLYNSGASVSAYNSFNTNRVSSIYNRRTAVVRWFVDQGYSGTNKALSPGYTDDDLANDWLMNDNIESHAG